MTFTDTQNNGNDVLSEDSLTVFLEEIRQYPLLSADEEKELARRYVQGDGEAGRRLCSCNLRLVVSIAKEFTGRGVPLLELIAGGNVGLVYAATKFDPEKDCRFSTYATDWIKQGIRICLKQNGSLIRVANYTAERIRKVLTTRAALEKELGEQPTVEEIAEACGFTVEAVTELLGYDLSVSSLNAPVGEDGTLENILENEEADSPERKLAREELSRIMELLLSKLDERQALVIRLRFGMIDGEYHSLEEIGKLLGISKERVRQIEKSAKERLKKLGVDFGLEDFLDD